mmetsp:Transcript_20162/g.55600  ORF Transcript_20162/g.55600 Transcript_20162/m.55600 type:complete len:96 (+) Transcript_20162:353-640(+)
MAMTMPPTNIALASMEGGTFRIAKMAVAMKALGLQRSVKLPFDLNLEGGLADAHGLGDLDGRLESGGAMLRPINHEMGCAQDVLRPEDPNMQVMD